MKSRLIDLREKLAKRLARQIGNPTIEGKELKAFDLIVDRREFLRGVGIGTVATLVGSSMAPTAWGKVSRECRVRPSDVGLTQAEMASVTQATGVDYGTELFEDTINAEPVVAPNEPFNHGLIEAARSRMRVQSQIGDPSPLEQSFYDSGYHFGPSELVQIEQDESGVFEIVHYFYPWTARNDGGRAGGLVRNVIMDSNHYDLTNPTKVYCITGSHTNEFITGSSGQQQVAASYLVYVEQNQGQNYGLIAIGYVLSSVDSGQVTNESDYPISWEIQYADQLGLPQKGNTYTSDKYVNGGLDLAVPGEYAPENATEHIVIYMDSGHIKIISLDDITTPGSPILIVTEVSLPEGTTSANIPRVAHIEYAPVIGATEQYVQLSDYALVLADADVLTTYTNQSRNAKYNGGYQSFKRSSSLQWLQVTYQNDTYEAIPRTVSTSPDTRPDYTTLQSINGLASTDVSLPAGSPFSITSHLKIGNFPGTQDTTNYGMCQFVLSRQLGDDDGNDLELVTYRLLADYPVAVPDAAGIGKITDISGGVSKFGGLRLFASDDIGNLYMLRQRRVYDVSNPYTAPIYIQNDENGNPATFSTTQLMSLPSGTAPDSNLQGYHQWMEDFYLDSGGLEDQEAEGHVAYNFLLNGLLGFGTGDSNEVQASWLGSGVQAVYAPKRFGHDGEHMVVREESDDGTNSQFNVYNVFNNIVEKTWVSRRIASQTVPDSGSLQESGDFYQATIFATNAYKDQVALNDSTNPGLQIEVRGDAPATVIDLVNNKYYDVDRYTSFVALPDQTTNQLRLAVKAENFAQILYVRLLQTDQLSPSSGDSAMLDGSSSSGGTATEWVAINIAAQAQSRMAATSTTSTPDSSCGSCDETVYVCTASLCNSNSQNNWQTKGGYSPSDSNLGSLSSYMNQSGQNLSDASSTAANNGLGGADTDPLTSTTPLTADSNRTAMQTSFHYNSGTITVGPPSTSTPGLPGNVFSSVGHALHDAFHWLQHVEGELYNSLANGVDVVIDDTEDISVTIAADIMKQVNGIDEDLNEVVSTVEEYASVVVNVVVTIVESSFIYKFVELLIALISLFIYLQDIKNLSDSLKSLIKGLPTGSPYPLAPVDLDYPWEDKLNGYVGWPNNVESDAGQAEVDEVVDEVVDGLLNSVLKNPLSKKLLDEVVSALTRALNEVSSSPVSFNMDSSFIDSQLQLLEDFSDDVDALFVNLSDDAINFLINQVVEDVEDPKASYSNFISGLGQFMDEVDADVMESVYTLLSQLAATDSNAIDEIMSQSDFIELKIPLLADLYKLFKIGDTSGNNVVLGSGDAISFVLALIIWVAMFEATGRSYSNINQLIPSSPEALDDLPGATTNDKLTFASACVAVVTMTLNGAIWGLLQTLPPSERRQGLASDLGFFGEYMNLMRWTMAESVTSLQLATGQASTAWTNDYLPTCTYIHFVTAVSGIATYVSPITVNPLAITVTNSFVNLVEIVWSIVDAAAVSADQPSGADWAILVGDEVGRAGVFGRLLYAWLYGTEATYEDGLDSLPYFTAYVVLTALGGFGAVAGATGVQKGITAPPPGAENCSQPLPEQVDLLISLVEVTPIDLPGQAQCQRESHLTGLLMEARQAYAQGDKAGGDVYLVRFGRAVHALRRSRRIAASDADLIMAQVEVMLACPAVG